MSVSKESEDLDDLNMLRRLDPEDLTPKQMRKIIYGERRNRLARHLKTAAEKESQDSEADEEREALADLMAEKGDGKPPKVSKDDLPFNKKSNDKDDKDEEEDEEENS